MAAVKETKAHEKAKEFVKHKMEIKEDKPEFKLKRFQNVEPRTQTKRPKAAGENSPPKEEAH